MPTVKQFSSGIEIPLCHLGTLSGAHVTLGFPASYIGVLKVHDYVIIETHDFLVDAFSVTKDYNCPHHEGQRHVLVSVKHADNLDLLYFFDARNKERKARREEYEKIKKEKKAS